MLFSFVRSPVVALAPAIASALLVLFPGSRQACAQDGRIVTVQVQHERPVRRFEPAPPRESADAPLVHQALTALGVPPAAHDLNHDGWIDITDVVQYFADEQPPADPIDPDVHALGNCCMPNGECIHLIDVVACKESGGTPVFPGCGDCESFGACCLLDGSCVRLKEADCREMGATFQGAGVTCDRASCPPDSCSPPPCTPPAIGGAATVAAAVLRCTGSATYPIVADSCAAAQVALHDPAGQTDVQVSYQTRTAHKAVKCPAPSNKWVCRAHLSWLQVTIDVKITLPSWTNESNAPAADQAAWNAFIAALTTHEQGHANIDCTSAALFENALKAVPDQIGCGDSQAAACADADAKMAQALAVAFAGAMAQLQTLQNQYHAQVGETVPINCP